MNGGAKAHYDGIVAFSQTDFTAEGIGRGPFGPSGRLSPRVDPRDFSLDSVAEAYELVRGRSSRANVVVNVAD